MQELQVPQNGARHVKVVEVQFEFLIALRCTVLPVKGQEQSVRILDLVNQTFWKYRNLFIFPDI